jgi:phosphoglycolate phosphatase
MSTHWLDSIVFDLDGTILHSLPGIEYSIREAFAVTRRPFRDGDLRELIGPPISTILSMVGNVKDERTLKLLEDAFRTSYDDGGWRKTELFPDTKVVLEALRREDFRLFIVTNKPKKISMRIMEYLGISDLFEAILTRDSRAPRYSGKEEMLRTLAEQHGIDLQGSLMVGDTMEDAKASTAVGMPFAFTAQGYGKIDHDVAVPIVLRLDCLGQLLPLLVKELVHD